MKKAVLAVLLAAVVFVFSGCSLIQVRKNVQADKRKAALAYMEIGDFAYKSKRFNKALENYDQALKEYEFPVLYKKIAYCLYRMGNKKEAMMVYRHAMNLKLAKNN